MSQRAFCPSCHRVFGPSDVFAMEGNLACPGCATRLDWTLATHFARAFLGFVAVGSLLVSLAGFSRYVGPGTALLLGVVVAAGVAIGGVAAGPWYFRYSVRKGVLATAPPKCPDCGEEFDRPVTGPCPVCGASLNRTGSTV